MAKRVLVTGASGFLGSYAARQFQKDGAYVVGQTSSQPASVSMDRCVVADFMVPGSAHDLVLEHGSDLVFHAAALANVDACEHDPDRAQRLNGDICEEMATACAKMGSKLVAISTDQLWSDAPPFIPEGRAKSPMNVYGISKSRGEDLALNNPDSLVLRTNFFGDSLTNGGNLIKFIRSSIDSGVRINGFTDIHFSPIFVGHLITFCMLAINADLKGVYNLAGRDRVSKYQFIVDMLSAMNLDAELVEPSLVSEAEQLAPRPHEMSLCYQKIETAIGRSVPRFSESLQSYLKPRA